jgi:hypothetical protein
MNIIDFHITKILSKTTYENLDIYECEGWDDGGNCIHTVYVKKGSILKVGDVVQV